MVAAVIFGIAMVSSGEETLAPLFLYGVMASLVTFLGVTTYVALKLVTLFVQHLLRRAATLEP